MYKKIGMKCLCIICVILVLGISFTACKQKSTDVYKQSSQNASLLNDISIEDKFQYKDFTWFISESDFFTKSKMDEKTSLLSLQGNLKLISDKKNQTYKEPNISMFPVFYFSDGKLTKVQLNAVFADEKSFLEAAKQLKTILDKNLNIKPSISNTDFLNEIPSQTGAGLGNVKWTGNDKSSMEIKTFNHSKTTLDNSNYVISIEINPPASATH